MAAQSVAVSKAERRELYPIRRCERCEIAFQLVRIHESRLELTDRLERGIREPRCRCRGAELAKLDSLDRTAYRERALNVRRDRHSMARSVGQVAKQVIERADHARQQRRSSPHEVSLDAIDVDPVRNDEPRITLEHVEIPLQKQGDLADVRRPDDERETHRFIVVPASGALSYAPAALCAKCVEVVEKGPGPGQIPDLAEWDYVATDFGLRPRRATCWPGIPAAQSSQRSACFDPRRASV